MNTREYRTRKNLEEERHKLVQIMTELNSDYKPPLDYKPLLQRVSERVAIPAEMNPNINFVGLLIGPRGNTLKKIEKESNCKIMIRGKGSVKEGKVIRKDSHPLPGEDEPLHALVSSNSIEHVKIAVEQIQKIIKQGIEQPEEENDLRKLQLMELAKLNGTLREDLLPRERAWLKPENQNVTNTTVCAKCGGRGHLLQDCRSTQTSNSQTGQAGGSLGGGIDRAKMDSEYMSLMAEIGESTGPSPSSSNYNSKPSVPSMSRHHPHNNINNNRPPPRPMMPPAGNSFNQSALPRFGGSRPPWVGPRPPRGRGGHHHGFAGGPHGPPRVGFDPRGGNGGVGFRNRPPHSMMNRGPPPSWMAPPRPFNHQQQPPNQWGAPPPSGGGNMGGYQRQPPPQQQSQHQHDNEVSNGGWPQGNGNFEQAPPSPYHHQHQPPPPPPSSVQQQPTPSSNDWNQYAEATTTNNNNNADQSMLGYGNNGAGSNNMWNMSPMQPLNGPGPVPPPPPSNQDGGMSYMMGGYSMPPPPPPPPPPQQSH